jgi:lipoprotein-releasing system permease protein
MVVLTKYKDIAILAAMGAKGSRLPKFFVMQGLWIGVMGTCLGLVLGHLLCYFANTYLVGCRSMNPVYALSFVPV